MEDMNYESSEEEFGVSEFEPACKPSEFVEEETTVTQKKYGRKFLVTLITMILGTLTFALNVFQHGDEVVSIISLAIVIVSDLNYVITEGRLDLASINKITKETEELIDKTEDLYTECFSEKETEEKGE